MTYVILFLALLILMVIGLMPGSIEDRGLLVAVMLSAFALLVVVEFGRVLREKARRARRSERRYGGWKSSRERRQDLGVRRRAVSRDKRGSRVLGVGTGVSSGRPRVSQSSLRRQRELRVGQGRRDAGQRRAGARQFQGVASRSNDRASTDTRHSLDVEQSRAGSKRRPHVSPEAARRQEELRI